MRREDKVTHREVSEQPALFYNMGKLRVSPTAIFFFKLPLTLCLVKCNKPMSFQTEKNVQVVKVAPFSFLCVYML